MFKPVLSCAAAAAAALASLPKQAVDTITIGAAELRLDDVCFVR